MLPSSGIYQLVIEVESPLDLTVGALGPCRFEPGVYIYTGSAKRNLPHRVARHRLREKRVRWHIDYLTVVAPPVAVRVFPLDVTECERHRELLALPGVREPVRGFGSSDCRCGSHLARLGRDRAAWQVMVSQPGGLAVQWS